MSTRVHFERIRLAVFKYEHAQTVAAKAMQVKDKASSKLTAAIKAQADGRVVEALRARAAWLRHGSQVEDATANVVAAAAELLETLKAGGFDLGKGPPWSEGIDAIATERHRQVTEEGWSAEHDAQHDGGQMTIAAACYAVHGTDAKVVSPHSDDGWPWSSELDKRSKHDRVKQLAIAGALIAAEIDRVLSRSAEMAGDR